MYFIRFLTWVYQLVTVIGSKSALFSVCAKYACVCILFQFWMLMKYIDNMTQKELWWIINYNQTFNLSGIYYTCSNSSMFKKQNCLFFFKSPGSLKSLCMVSICNISAVRNDDFFPYRFCGFESDVVVIKRQFHNINLSGRFVFILFYSCI